MYGESLAGVRHETIYSQIEASIDPYRTPGDPLSGLLHGISDEPFGTPGQGDDHLMAFSFRLPLTDNKDNQLPIYKPEGYDPSHYELYRRHAQAGGRLYKPIVRIPGSKTDIVGCESPLHLDLVGMSDGWANGSVEKRREILDRATLFSKGLLYFYITDESLPVSFRSVLIDWPSSLLFISFHSATNGNASATPSTSSLTTTTSRACCTSAMRAEWSLTTSSPITRRREMEVNHRSTTPLPSLTGRRIRMMPDEWCEMEKCTTRGLYSRTSTTSGNHLVLPIGPWSRSESRQQMS